MPKIKKTTEEFVEKAIVKHGNKYCYDKSTYIDTNTKICITCKIHGDFYQLPRKHLLGQGCYECGMIEGHNKRKHTNEYVDQFLTDNNIQIKRIGNYTNNYTQIEWQCLICNNVWNVTPESILKKRGCPNCYKTKQGK
jgi:hypothetical protein